MVQNKQNVNMSSFHWIQKWSRRDSDAYFGAPSVKQTLVGRLTWPNFVSTFGIAQTSKKRWRQHILLSIASFLPQQNLQGLSYPLPSIYSIYVYKKNLIQRAAPPSYTLENSSKSWIPRPDEKGPPSSHATKPGEAWHPHCQSRQPWSRINIDRKLHRWNNTFIIVAI